MMRLRIWGTFFVCLAYTYSSCSRIPRPTAIPYTTRPERARARTPLLHVPPIVLRDFDGLEARLTRDLIVPVKYKLQPGRFVGLEMYASSAAAGAGWVLRACLRRCNSFATALQSCLPNWCVQSFITVAEQIVKSVSGAQVVLYRAHTELTTQARDLFISIYNLTTERSDLLRAWVLSASVVFSFVFLFRRLAKRFTEQGAQEVLIDVADESYSSYGGTLNTLSRRTAQVMKNMQKKCSSPAIQRLHKRILRALDEPCFPASMATYTWNMLGTIGDIIHFWDHMWRSGAGRDPELQALVSDPSAISYIEEAITVLEARVLDTQLRVLRNNLLMSAIEFEGLVRFWRRKVEDRTQTLRLLDFPLLPKPKRLLTSWAVQSRLYERVRVFHTRFKDANTFVGVTSSKHADANSSPDVHHNNQSSRSHTATGAKPGEPSDKKVDSSANQFVDSHPEMFEAFEGKLNPREKVSVLESMLAQYYETIGFVQSQLDELQTIDTDSTHTMRLQQWIENSVDLVSQVSEVIRYPLRGITAGDGANLTQEPPNLSQSSDNQPNIHAPPTAPMSSPMHYAEGTTSTSNPTSPVVRGGYVHAAFWGTRNVTNGSAKIPAMDVSALQPRKLTTQRSYWDWWRHMFGLRNHKKVGFAQTHKDASSEYDPSTSAQEPFHATNILTDSDMLTDIEDVDTFAENTSYAFDEDQDISADDVRIVITPLEESHTEPNQYIPNTIKDSPPPAYTQELSPAAEDIDARESGIPVLRSSRTDQVAAENNALAAFGSIRTAQAVCLPMAQAWRDGKMEAEQKMYLSTRGLYRTKSTGLGIVRQIFRLLFWSAFFRGCIQLHTHRSQVAELWYFVQENAKEFCDRRLVSPAKAITQDLLLNKRERITDLEALDDAKKSLQRMLYEFMKDTRKDLTDQQIVQISNNCDMTVVSLEYERALRSSLRSVVTGSIVRMLLIQVQFLKKELLVAMQAIDELFNANKFNLQLLAIIPALLSAAFASRAFRQVFLLLTSFSRGKVVATRHGVFQSLRSHVRDIERLLVLSQAYQVSMSQGHTIPVTSQSRTSTPATKSQDPQNTNETNSLSEMQQQEISAQDLGFRLGLDTGYSTAAQLTARERGQLLSILYDIHSTLVTYAQVFDRTTLKQLREDVRDLARPSLSVAQRLAVVHRLLRSYDFMQPSQTKRGLELL